MCFTKRPILYLIRNLVFLLWYDRTYRTTHRTMFYLHRTKRPSYHPLQAIITLDGEWISTQTWGSLESPRRALSNGKNLRSRLVDARKLWPVLGDSIIPTNNRLVPEKYEPVSGEGLIVPWFGVIVPPIVPYKGAFENYRTKLHRTMTKTKKKTMRNSTSLIDAETLRPPQKIIQHTKHKPITKPNHPIRESPHRDSGFAIRKKKTNRADTYRQLCFYLPTEPWALLYQKHS